MAFKIGFAWRDALMGETQRVDYDRNIVRSANFTSLLINYSTIWHRATSLNIYREVESVDKV